MSPFPRARKIPSSIRWGLVKNRTENGLSGPGFPSGHAEYAVVGEQNRFRYVALEHGWKLEDGPGRGPNGEKRLFALVGWDRPNSQGGKPMLFQEMTECPLDAPEGADLFS